MPMNERMPELLRKLGKQECGFDVFINLADAEEPEQIRKVYEVEQRDEILRPLRQTP